MVKSGVWNSTGEDISIVATGLSVGEYNYTAIFTDVGSNSISDSANVTVVDATNPTVSSPADLSYKQGATGNYINWTGSDLNPATYMVTIDSILTVSGLWNSSLEIITASVDGLGDGVHTASITLYDESSNSISDSVTVTVSDGIAPLITQPENVTYIERKVGNWFSWLTTDAHPSDYVVYRDNEVLKSGPLNDTSETITLFIDGLSVGLHNYTLLVSDSVGNTATNTVWVTVIEST
ncbi:MAG: hypothetical protein P1Q69_12825 [Candidatus Thorarchaeota archaeon]|nr:hypothetical protein [Candidatus Thorarchaeota archaeon]